MPIVYTWLPVLFWGMIIALESAFGSPANTGPLLQKFITLVFSLIDTQGLEVIHYLLRKAGHFLGYGIFGYLWFRALVRTYSPSLACAGLAVACVFCCAVLDEWHQSILPERSGEAGGVVLDTFGGLAFVSFGLLMASRSRWENRASG